MDPDVKRFVINFAMGGVSGMVTKTFFAPLDNIKFILQNQYVDPKFKSGELSRDEGIIDCATRIYKEQGIWAFWKGHVANCLRFYPIRAFNLYFKDTFKKLFPKYSPKTEFAKFFGANLVSGGLAAAGSMAIVYPLDFARDRLMYDSDNKFEGIADVIRQTVSLDGGFLNFYTGFGASLMGTIALRGVQLLTLDIMVGLNPWRAEKGLKGAFGMFLSAQAAERMAQALTYPFHTVHITLLRDSAKIYLGTFDCFKKIAAEEGLSGFYTGFLMHTWLSLIQVVTSVFYDRTKKCVGI